MGGQTEAIDIVEATRMEGLSGMIGTVVRRVPRPRGMAAYVTWALAEKILATVPGGKSLYHGVGEVVNRGKRGLRGNSPSSLRMINRARAYLPPGGTAIEVGTGWFHREAFLLYLLDRDTTVYLFDIEDKARLGAIHTYLADIVRHAAVVAEHLDLDELKVRARIEPLLKLDSREAIYSACGFKLMIVSPDRLPFLPPDSVDVMVSNCVLNHIPPRVLVPELRALGVMLRPAGRMIHVLGHEDHWTFRAPGVNRFNFYRYSDASYARWFESLEYHNRMVKPEWLAAFEQAGLDVEAWEPEITDKSLAEIEALPHIDARFAGTSHTDLAAIKTMVTLRRMS
jgi:SAM-dependent methyltransferase